MMGGLREQGKVDADEKNILSYVEGSAGGTFIYYLVFFLHLTCTVLS